MKDKALRYNTGKSQYSLLALDCLEPCVRVLEFGAKKYARNNWRKGMPQTQILDSLMRHITALLSGELIDPESGLPHIGHIQCNAMFLANPNNVQDLDKTELEIKENEIMDKEESLTKEEISKMWANWPYGPMPPGWSKLHCHLYDDEEKEVD